MVVHCGIWLQIILLHPLSTRSHYPLIDRSQWAKTFLLALRYFFAIAPRQTEDGLHLILILCADIFARFALLAYTYQPRGSIGVRGTTSEREIEAVKKWQYLCSKSSSGEPEFSSFCVKMCVCVLYAVSKVSWRLPVHFTYVPTGQTTMYSVPCPLSTIRLTKETERERETIWKVQSRSTGVSSLRRRNTTTSVFWNRTDWASV